MTDPTYGAAGELARLAGKLNGPRDSLPALFAFTDPVRTPDPILLAESLPPGSGLVFRTFGKPDLEAMAPVLAAIAEIRGMTLLIAADPRLASQVGAHGVHWPEARLPQAARTRFQGIQTASAHSPMAVRKAQGLVDAVFVSPAFASESPSAGRPLGPFRIQAHANRSRIPVYALGGINARTVRRLAGFQVAGVAAIEGLRQNA